MTRMSRSADFAARLAIRMLASEWGRDDLLISCRRAIGGEPVWLPSIVDAVLQQFPTKPAGRPRALTAVIIAALDTEVAGSGSTQQEISPPSVEIEVAAVRPHIDSLPVGDLDPVEQRMATSRWPVPPIGTESALADLLRVDLPVLLWIADPRGLNRGLPDGKLHPYRYRWVDRPGRTPRLLEAPGPLLRHVQRRLLDKLITHIPTHPAAYGFVPGRSVVSHAAHHAGRRWVITFDLQSFFAGIRTARVAGVFATAGYPEPIVRLIAGLATSATPRWILGGMPTDGAAEDRALLRARLRTRHLPQGAPSSPAIANLVAFHLDRRLDRLAERSGFRYTRYADDLTFSGNGDRPAERFVDLVRSIIVSEGFRPNDRKFRIRGRSARQTVTGIVVNDHPNLNRPEYDRLRAILHDAVRHGPEVANRHRRPDFRAYLEGRVGWVEQLNPARGARLRRQLQQITWPPNALPAE